MIRPSQVTGDNRRLPLGFVPGPLALRALGWRWLSSAFGIMNTVGKIGLAIALGMALVLAQGCKPSAEKERIARLEQFRKDMEQIDASIVLGMPYSNLVTKIGEPFWSHTNDGWVMTIYTYDPHVFHALITNGFRVDISNGIVIRKFETTGSFH